MNILTAPGKRLFLSGDEAIARACHFVLFLFQNPGKSDGRRRRQQLGEASFAVGSISANKGQGDGFAGAYRR